MDKKTPVIITTIFEATESVRKFADNPNNHLIVAGDKKTPLNWNIDGAKADITFLPFDKSLNSSLEKVLPYNHYCRKMMGYIWAKNAGAEFIYETDDDNYPKSNWEPLNFNNEELFTPSDMGYVNVYKYFSDEDIWPRGYPLELITDKKHLIDEKTLEKKDLKIGIYQGLVDNEPDVDAIYRLTNNKKCDFNDKPSVALSKGTVCPFNTQNTFTRRELFPLLYLPSTVTFRFTDILRGLVAQPLMWNEGYHLCFTKATAIQERNVHNYLKDFESEIPCYLYAQKVIDVSNSVIKSEASLKDNMFNVYNALYNEGIVKKEELDILNAWLKDI